MYTITVTLDADDTPKSIATLAALATCVSVAGTAAVIATGTTSLIYKKLRSVCSFFTIRGESGNDVSAGGAGSANGAARVGFDANVSRGAAAATVHGEECLPGIRYDFPSVGAGQVYAMQNTYLCGKTGDVFQIEFGTL